MKYLVFITLVSLVGCSGSKESINTKTNPIKSKTYESDLVVLDSGLKMMFSKCEEPKKPAEIIRTGQKRLQYPSSAVRAGHQEVVKHQLLIDKEGEIEEIELIKGRYESLIKESKRVIQFAEFSPAICSGDTVKMYYPIETNFKLSDS